MLWRVQSFWLLLAAVCGFLTLNFSFYSGVKTSDNLFHFLNGKENTLILVLTVLNTLGSLLVIFLFKNRKRQFWSTILCLVFSLLIITLYILQTKNYSQGTYNIWAIFSLAMPILFILAARAIDKDEKLVKSLDRLR